MSDAEAVLEPERSWFSSNCIAKAAQQRIGDEAGGPEDQVAEAEPGPAEAEPAAAAVVQDDPVGTIEEPATLAASEPAPAEPTATATEPPPLPTPVPTATPRPEPVSVIDRFIEGYRWAGGPEVHLNRIVTRVIPCESSGNPHAYSTVGPFFGLMQFLDTTWVAVGGGDWTDPWQQGVNTAVLLASANPTTQWPVCWFA